FANRTKTFVFDPVADRFNARSDPDFFLQNNAKPLFLDEIQYAPELLASIKRDVDKHKEPGMYILSGSQNLSVLKNISESLAGRVSIQNLLPMSVSEQYPRETNSFLSYWISKSADVSQKELDTQKFALTPPESLLRCIWRGGYPGLLDMPDSLVSNYFQSYIQTYIERDVRSVSDIKALGTFSQFFGLLAALTSSEINQSQLGRELGVDQKTALQWLTVAEATYQWIKVPAFSRNPVKRISGKPKGYFTDTGLACFLQKIMSPEVIMSHPFLGRLMETFIVMEIKKLTSAWTMEPSLYHYRSHGGGEVDLIMDINGILFPIEIKAKTNPSGKDCRGFDSFRKTFPAEKIGTNLIVCSIEQPMFIRKATMAVPWWVL
ncbi:MAG: ATP-binding protein, partial [Fibrobacteria bacterium]|nr:ATP-binding protein [Fibrobacteria bacterium]